MQAFFCTSDSPEQFFTQSTLFVHLLTACSQAHCINIRLAELVSKQGLRVETE